MKENKEENYGRKWNPKRWEYWVKKWRVDGKEYVRKQSNREGEETKDEWTS